MGAKDKSSRHARLIFKKDVETSTIRRRGLLSGEDFKITGIENHIQSLHESLIKPDTIPRVLLLTSPPSFFHSKLL